MYQFDLGVINKTHDQIRAVVEKNCIYSFQVVGSKIVFQANSYPSNSYDLTFSTAQRHAMIRAHNKEYREYIKTFEANVLPLIRQELSSG